MFKNPKIHQNILAIPQPFHAILLDAYGVFWGGNSRGLFAGAKEMMEELISSGKTIGILSNSTQLSTKEREKFKAHGLLQDRHFHFLITSGDVAKNLFFQEELPFETPQKKYWLFGGTHPKFSPHLAIFQESAYTETTHLHEADFIYIAIPHVHGEDQTDPSLFQKEVQALVATGLPMVCANPDRFAHEGDPVRAVVRQGSIARMYEEFGGTVFYIGKPHANVYEQAMGHFYERNIYHPSEILMVGDTPETDIRGAHQCGMASALTTTTGIMADRILHQGIVCAIAGLSADEFPDFFIEGLS